MSHRSLVSSGLTRRLLLQTGAAAGAIAGLVPRRANAVVRLDVTQGNVQPMPIALPDFLAGGTAEGDTPRNITQIIASNLKRSGLFAPIDQAAYIEKISNTDAVPRFPDWRTINAQALLVGRITRQPDGRLKAEFRLWDVYGGTQLAGQQFITSYDNWRRVAHIISDMIYERLTGDKGYFDTRIVFVDETGTKEQRIKRLAIMDQDAANASYLTDGSTKVMTPRFSADSQEVAYMALSADSARIYVFNLETGRQESVGEIKGTTGIVK